MFRFQVKKNGFDVSLVKLLALSSFVCLCETEFQFCVECVSYRERKRESKRVRGRERVCVCDINSRKKQSSSFSIFLSFFPVPNISFSFSVESPLLHGCWKKQKISKMKYLIPALAVFFAVALNHESKLLTILIIIFLKKDL